MLEIVEIKRQMKQGQTAPFLCSADDGRQYIVKGARATPQGLVKEWIAANLAKAFGLPIPEFKIAYVDQELVEYGYDDLGSGFCFASLFTPNIQDITYAAIPELPREVLRDLFIFDYWIKNDDRFLTKLGGNPNLFFNPINKSVVVLDHNLAFEQNFKTDDHINLHVGRQAWFASQPDMFCRINYEAKFENASSRLDEIIAGLPKEWLEFYQLDSIEREIIVVLRKYNEPDFWEDLR